MVGPRVATGFVALLVTLVAPVGVHGMREACAGAAGGPTVAVVVDFGDVASQGTPPAGVVSGCVDWSSGYRGADALRDAGFTLTFHQSGLLCSIDGYPATGCGERTGNRKYVYWAYWKATGGADTWTYSVTGAATKINSGGTEGWRLVEGEGSPNDPQPRAAASHDATCTDSGTPVAPEGPGVSSGDGGGSNGSPNGDAGAASPGPSADPSTPSGGDDAAVTDASVADDTAPSIDGSTGTGPANVTGGGAEDAELAAATPSTDGSDTGAVVGVVVVAALIALLAGGARWQTRRRSD